MNQQTLSEHKVLLVEDSFPQARCYSEFLRQEAIHTRCASDISEAILLIKQEQPDLILLDLHQSKLDGMELLKSIRAKNLDVGVVVIIAHDSYEMSRAVLELGATDYLEKPFNKDRLCLTVRNALVKYELEKQTLKYELGYEGFIGSSQAMRAVYEIIEHAGPSKASIFITGESGTGKELCAQAIHRHGLNPNAPCVTLNCAAIPHNLMESEIFGHVKGAFTGAINSREGAAHRAHGGTLFLDEVGEMSLDLQSKLLRFIQTGEFQKVGSNVMETVSVRFISATNRDPLEEVKSGNFREDLYYRLHVVPIHLPPLRDRGLDILSIAQHFLLEFALEEKKTFQAFSEETKAIFLNYPWPGNVRQLVNVVRNIVVLHDAPMITPKMLPQPLNIPNSTDRGAPLEKAAPRNKEAFACQPATITNALPIKPLWQVELEAIDAAVTACDGNIAAAAKLLEVSPSTLYRKRPNKRKTQL